MSDKLYCTYCGALNEAGAIFCERCGHELEPIDVPAKDTKPATEQDDLLTVLMEEPVTQIPDEPAAPVKKAAAAADTGRADADVLNENTQLFSRTELNAAIAASEAQKGTAAAQKEAELARQKERLIEESIRYYEDEKRDREEQRIAKSRRQQEDALYADFEKQKDAGYGGKAAGYTAGYGAAPKKKKTWIPILVIVLLALAAGGFFGWKFFFDKTTVDLTRNISSQDIYLEGDNEEASVIIDDETLRARADYPRGNEKAEQFMQTVSYTAEPATGLSNGDTVVIRAIYSEETAKSLHINVKGEEKKFEVSGLEEKATINWDPLGLFDGKDKTDDTAQPADTLIPEIDTRYYTDKDVQGKSKDDVQAMLNELYARHGYIFQDATLKSQYEKQSWYKGTESDMSKVEQSFNTYEKKNLEYLTEVRSKL